MHPVVILLGECKAVPLCPQTAALLGVHTSVRSRRGKLPDEEINPSAEIGSGGGKSQYECWQPEKAINLLSFSRNKRENEHHSPLWNDCPFVTYCKLSYLPEKWVCNALWVEARKANGCEKIWDSPAFLGLHLHVPIRNIFIKPKIIHHNHNPLVSGKNTGSIIFSFSSYSITYLKHHLQRIT